MAKAAKESKTVVTPQASSAVGLSQVEAGERLPSAKLGAAVEDDDARPASKFGPKDDAADATVPAEKAGEEITADESEAESLASRARDAGLDDDEIAELEKAGSLKTAVRYAERQAARTPAKQEKEERQESKVEPAALEAYKIGLDPAKYDAEVIKEFENLTAWSQKQIAQAVADAKSAREVSGKIEAAYAEEKQAQFVDEIDEWREKLGADYAELFGTGSLIDLKPGSTQAKANERVIDEVLTRIQIAQKNGRRPDTLKVLLDKALKSEFGAEVDKVASKKAAAVTDARRSQFVSRPTQREAAVEPRARAIEKVSKILNRANLR